LLDKGPLRRRARRNCSIVVRAFGLHPIEEQARSAAADTIKEFAQFILARALRDGFVPHGQCTDPPRSVAEKLSQLSRLSRPLEITGYDDNSRRASVTLSVTRLGPGPSAWRVTAPKRKSHAVGQSGRSKRSCGYPSPGSKIVIGWPVLMCTVKCTFPPSSFILHPCIVPDMPVVVPQMAAGGSPWQLYAVCSHSRHNRPNRHETQRPSPGRIDGWFWRRESHRRLSWVRFARPAPRPTAQCCNKVVTVVTVVTPFVS
jgi:hypothetical protein